MSESPPDIAKLEKEIRFLSKKLARSEANRIALETMWDRNSSLFITLNKEIEAQEALVRSKNDELEILAKKLAKYLSPQVYSSIFTGARDVRLETNRKKLTIFFSDIVGFTSQTDEMEPEDLTYLLNTYLDKMAQIVLKYGGTLDKFIGDAILVFFGDPETKGIGEDAKSCVQMAIDMQAAIGDLEKIWAPKGIAQNFQVRMGITTGYCTVGNFGSEERMDYTIIGNRVNLASRLESNAAPGSIQISHDTWNLVREDIHCIKKDSIQVKGFDRVVEVYEVQLEGKADTTPDKLNESLCGFSLNINMKDLIPDDRPAVIAKLNEAIQRLNSLADS